MIKTKELDENTLKKNKRRKSYLKLNIISLFFTAISFISVTLAWFAYSGLITAQTEVDIKAWLIEFDSNGETVANNMMIMLDDVYPGMDPITESINIKNLGDSDAMISYKIRSIRILDEVYEIDELDNLEKFEDQLSNEYPFHLNFSLSNNIASAKDGVGSFSVSVSWPLDSGDDEKDTLWGVKAYNFQANEASKLKNDENYQVRKPIELQVSLEAVQYVGDGIAPDTNYPLGKMILYDVINNQVCSSEGGSCIKTYVVDKNNQLSDSNVTLLPLLDGTYVSGTYYDYDSLFGSVTNGWTVTKRKMKVEDLLNIVSKDINNTLIKADNISDQVLGYLDYEDRVNDKINFIISNNGLVEFKNNQFSYLSSNECIWLENDYDANNSFALVRKDLDTSKIYSENKGAICKVVPIIEVSKNKLNN